MKRPHTLTFGHVLIGVKGGVSLVLLGALWLVLARTDLGRAIRATTQDPRTAALVGVNVERITMLAFALGVSMAAAGGPLLGMLFAFYPSTHWLWIGKLLAIVVLGGLGSLRGMFVAAMVLGLAEQVASAAISPNLAPLVFYVFLTWAMSLGFGVQNASAWATNPGALDFLATKYVSSWFATLVDIAVVVDAFVAALAGTALVSRTAFAMGREGGLPKAFAWTHPRFKTPWVSILASLALTVILVSWLARGTWNDPFTYFAFMATTATFGILGTYILVSLAGMTYFFRTRAASAVSYNVLLDVVLPLAAIVVCALTIYWSIFPRPPAPISYSIWVALGWFGLGVAYLLWLRLRSPDKVAQFGSVLAEGGDAASPPSGEAAPA